MHVAEFGVVMMLFLVGLELRPNLLWRLRGPILGTGGLQVILTTLAITVLAPLKTRFLCQHANRPGRQDCNEEWQHITRHRIIADAVNRIGHQSDAKDAETDQRELSRKAISGEPPDSQYQEEKKPSADRDKAPMPDE